MPYIPLTVIPYLTGMVIHITATTMGFNLTDTGHIPITDTDPTVMSVGLGVLAEVLVVADILDGVVAMVGTVEIMVEAVMSVALAGGGKAGMVADILGGVVAMVGTVAVLVVADPMDGEEDMAATDLTRLLNALLTQNVSDWLTHTPSGCVLRLYFDPRVF